MLSPQHNFVTLVAVNDGKVDEEEEMLDEAEAYSEYYAWNELRLHPLLMKSISRLGFKEPTPIRRACIPAAAHQGKDVIGAAETGSGKTLAFGLPIFQRLLEEQEKTANKLEEKGEEAGKYAPKGLLRALIITPTRELALQVTDHLKEFSKDINVRVVPIIGALSADFRKKLKRGSLKSKHSTEGLNSIEILSERAGMRPNAVIVDLTNETILAKNLEESFMKCREEDKDSYLYYILSIHGEGRTIVFCTSIAALRHISSILRILGVNVSTLHAQMQQQARLKDCFPLTAIDRFRANEHGILVATDVAARGLDIPGVRTVVHYQLSHSAEVYVHRSGRIARASSDGSSIALISPNDSSKFASLRKSFAKESIKQFPLENSILARGHETSIYSTSNRKYLADGLQGKGKQSRLEWSAESLELVMENYDRAQFIAFMTIASKNIFTSLSSCREFLTVFFDPFFSFL
ncbi:hypothetical protein REPUB_Repub15cG0034600 [Reevesia pubescens]